jgi:hypothetical protein
VLVNQLRHVRFVLVPGDDDLLVLLILHAQRVLRQHLRELFFYDLAKVFTGRGLAL